MINLIFKDWKLIVDLEGGRIVSLKNKDVLILGTFERIDGKKGNTHVCVPNFFEDGVKEFGLPVHGPFRNELWKLIQKTENLLEIECEVNNLNVHQIFSFNDEYFGQKVIIENKSDENNPVNSAIHNYWASDLGWEEVNLNDIDLSLNIEESTFVEAKNSNELKIPGKPLIKWELSGLKYAKLWTGFLEENGNKIFDNNYFCLEPIMEKDGKFFGSLESMLLPKTKIELEQKIGVVYRT